jgi:hypothetical protein
VSRFALAALAVGLVTALLSAVVVDHRLTTIEAWIGATPTVCALPPAAPARRQPADASRRAI